MVELECCIAVFFSPALCQFHAKTITRRIFSMLHSIIALLSTGKAVFAVILKLNLEKKQTPHYLCDWRIIFVCLKQKHLEFLYRNRYPDRIIAIYNIITLTISK